MKKYKIKKMEKKLDLLTKYLIESLNNYEEFKNKIQNIFSDLKENQKYCDIIMKYVDIEKDENYLQLFFLLFYHHQKFINPNKIMIFNYQNHFKLTKNNLHDDIERLIINSLDDKNCMKLFIYWNFYILILLSYIFKDNEKNTNDFGLIDIENILFQNNNKIINLYHSKKADISQLFVFLYIYSFFLEYFIKNNSHENDIKIINNILLSILFDLLEKISSIILSDKSNLEYFKSNVTLLFSFFNELKANEFILNDYNLIILLDCNIIQNFMTNLLKHINPKILENVFPSYLSNLTDFFATFLKFRFNKSKLMDFFINNLKNGLINLKYLSEDQDQIMNDVFLMSFQSELLQKIFINEDKNLSQSKFNSFLFNGKNSKLSFNIPKLSLNDNLIIFSFIVKTNFNEKNSFNINQPLFNFYNENNSPIFKLALKKVELKNEEQKENKNKFNAKDKFCLIVNINNEEKILKEIGDIEPNKTYFIAIHLNISFIKIYLNQSSGINSKLIDSYIESKNNFNEEKLMLNIGFDKCQKEMNYFSGYIGYFHVLQLYNINKNKIDYENNKMTVEAILSLKDYYKYLLFYLKKEESEYKTDISLDYISYFKNKANMGRAIKTLEFIKKESKNFYKIILFLSPEIFKLSVINDKKDIKFFAIPTISGICEKQKEFRFNDLNITYVRYENSRETFLMKNGLNFFCFQLEYFFQFGNYYSLFKKKYLPDSSFIDNESEDSFFEENKEICLKLIKSSINSILLILSKYIIDLKISNFFTELKQIFSTLLAVIKIISEIDCIIDSIFHQIGSIFIIICEQINIKHEAYTKSNDEKIKNSFEKDEEIKFFIPFRDSIIDMLLTKDFYIKSSPRFFETFFDKIISIIESNNLSHPNILIKVLNFSELLKEYFINYEPNSKNKKGDGLIVSSYLKLIKGLINTKKNNPINNTKKILYNNKAFKQLVSYVLKENHDNYFQNNAFFNLINDLINEGFSLDDEDLINLIEYFIEISTDIQEDSKDNNINNQCTIIINILINHIFEKNKKKSFNYFCNEIKQIELNEKLFSFIINGILKIFSDFMDSKNDSFINNQNENNIKNKKTGTENNKETENIDYKAFFEDLFEFLIIIIKKSVTKRDTSLENLKNENGENKRKISIDSIHKANGQDIIIQEIINLIFFIEEMISAHINNNSTRITTLYCLLNLIKLIHIIVFDNKLVELFKDDKVLILFKSMIESCMNSKILLTNFYLNVNENPSSVLKTIPEIILDILIELIKSDFIKNNKEESKKKEILTKNNLIQYLNEIFLIERKINNQKDNDENKRSLFIYNDLYRFFFSKKITNAENELKIIKKNKIISKYFPKFGDDFIYLNDINKFLANKEKKFNFNFITFNLEKIYKYKYNTDSQELPELSDFLEQLLTRLIKEQEILFQLDKNFFFRNNSEYSNYNLTKNKIEKMLLAKKFDYLELKKFLELNFSEKLVVVADFVTSGLCENINENKNKKKSKTDLNKSFEERAKKNTDFIEFGSSPGQLSNYYVSKSEKNDDHSSFYSKTGSFISISVLSEESNNEETKSPSETSSNYSPKSINSDALSAFCNLQTNTKNERPLGHIKSNSNCSLLSANPPDSKYFIDKNYFKRSSSKTVCNKNNKLEENINLNFLNKLDSMFLFNVKRNLIKNIFALNFLEPIFYDKTFLKLKKLFYQEYGDLLEKEITNKPNLNYSTKIKNFSNGLEPPLFVKPCNNFYDHKTFPISHYYFNQYVANNKVKYKKEYINLFQKEVFIPEKDKTCRFNCEIIKINHPIYGNITYSKSLGYLFFAQKNYEAIYNSNIKTYDYDGFFSWSTIKYREKENQKIKNVKSNKLFHNTKKLLILISDIEEIVERRFLYMWQGFEIYLKDGRSFFFNLLTVKNYEKFKKKLLENDEIRPLYHNKEFLTKNKEITTAWEKDIITTYEYLLIINKYSSRSFNDPNQYHVFPWLLIKFDNIIYINQKQNLLLNEKLSNKKDEDECEAKNGYLLNNLRDLKYALSLQNETSRSFSIYRYNEGDEHKFHSHLGTHYSTSSFIFYYLMRQEPYTSLLIKLQNYNQENPNRMFIGLEETIDILQNGNDNRELIPEFYSKIDYFLNLNYSTFGRRGNGKFVNNVNLNFLKDDESYDLFISDYVHFIAEHRKLLNSNLINSSINKWIDNIFGVGQIPNKKKIEESCNIYGKTSYERNMDLLKKIDKYKKAKKSNQVIRTKLMNKINPILLFGQTPYQVFKDQHQKKNKSNEKNEENSLSYNKKYNMDENAEDDDFSNLSKIINSLRDKSPISSSSICFDVNMTLNKIFSLSPNEINSIKFDINDDDSGMLSLTYQDCIKIPRIKLFENFTLNGIEYYLYKPKYAFSSFKEYEYFEYPSRKSSKISKDSKPKSVNISEKNFNFNEYYKNLFQSTISKKNSDIQIEENYKFIQCRYLDHSFKIYKVTKIKSTKKKEKDILIINSFSYISEDFVSSCRAVSPNQFLIGLDNGKLIRYNIINEEKDKIKIKLDKNIQAHKNRINAIEIDQRLGLIITCGKDNLVQIRKLYNLELILPISIKKKYLVTMAKISPINLLYIMCFDMNAKRSIIYGYTLSGIRFAKNKGGLYLNIDFTRSGNIVSLLNNKELCILNSYDLSKKDISNENLFNKQDLVELKELQGSIWLEYHYFLKNSGYKSAKISSSIIYIKKVAKKEKDNEKIKFDYMIFYHDFKENEVFE